MKRIFLLLLFPPFLAATPHTNAAPVAIDALVSRIVSAHPERRFYEAELAAARAGERAAGTRENPELAFSLGRKRVTDAAGMLAAEGTAWSVSVSQTFDWPGRIALRKAIANRDVELAELGLARFEAALANRARSLAHGLHAARERAAAASEVAARYRALRELFLARDPAGITPLLETRVIEAQELTLQKRATEARLAYRAALMELNQLRGAAADEPLELAPVSLRSARLPELFALLAMARENNFEFRAAKLELEQQGFTVSLARHEGRPSFTVAPYFEQEKAGGRERTFGVGITMPFPLNRRATANTAAAEARRDQAETAVLLAQRTLEREVTATAQRLAAKLDEIAAWSPDAAQKFRDAAELADRHFRLGAVPISTYVELQDSYLDAIDALHETQHEALEAAGQLELLTGLNLHAQEAANQ